MSETAALPTLVLDMPDSTDNPPPAGPPPETTAPEPVWRAVLLAPFRLRTWKELLYLVVVFVLDCAAATYLFFGLGGAGYLSIFLVGIPLLAAVILGGRIWGHVYRGLNRALLDNDLPEPPPFTSRPGLLGWLRGAFTDQVSWRALAFLVVQGALGVVVGYLTLVVVAMSVFLAFSPIPWALFHPVNLDSEGVEHHSLFQIGEFYVDSWPRNLAASAIGIVLCFALPWLIRTVCWAHRLLARWLLTPTARDRRVAELQQSRRAAVDDAAATLRRLERDLHDGTQARLVSIAMMLGRAEERLAAGGEASELIAQARAGSKEALTELRELVRGIHPPALELGLEAALETLAARSAVPVELRVMLPRRPSPAIESIAYFSVAELLTNVAKHAGANRIWVAVLPTGGDRIAVSVRDNGGGGALQPVINGGDRTVGGGLAGLAARALAVDGTLAVDSPVGGPTVVTLVLPLDGPQ
ncbi:sensor histidine kinase [Nocardia sp. NPDC055321]